MGFFENSKKRDVRELGASSFSDIANKKKFKGELKIAKLMFFRVFKIALFWPYEKHEFFDFKLPFELFLPRNITKT